MLCLLGLFLKYWIPLGWMWYTCVSIFFFFSKPCVSFAGLLIISHVTLFCCCCHEYAMFPFSLSSLPEWTLISWHTSVLVSTNHLNLMSFGSTRYTLFWNRLAILRLEPMCNQIEKKNPATGCSSWQLFNHVKIIVAGSVCFLDWPWLLWTDHCCNSGQCLSHSLFLTFQVLEKHMHCSWWNRA
jgi:hypothetical protein